MEKRRTFRKILWVWLLVLIGVCLKPEGVMAETYDPETCFYLTEIHEPVMAATIGDENLGNINNGVYVSTRNTGMNYDGDIYLNIVFYENPTTFSLTVTDNAGKIVKDTTVLSTDSNWYHIKKDGSSVTQDKYSYTMQLSFEEKQRFDIQMKVLQSDMPAASVKYEMISYQYEITSGPEVTVGFTEQLTVAKKKDMNLAVAKWTSGNPSVATVSSKGVVKGKKKGKTTVTAHFANGTTASKSVKVVPNEYSAAKLKKKNVKKGEARLGVHSIYYDKKGNLIIKANLVNRKSDPILYLRDISIKVSDQNGKLIGKYSMKKYAKYKKYYSYFLGSRMHGPFRKYDFSSSRVKTLTLKIPKSKLKQKKALLTTSCKIAITLPQYSYVKNEWSEMRSE